MDDHVALTWLLIERSTEKIAAYMSLIMDAIKLSFSEKELHKLNYPFKTIPAMKIAKLAVDRNFAEKYKGIGTFMIDTAERLANACSSTYCAARFITVDADIEHDNGVLTFYEKNGFIPNTELYNKNRKTVSIEKRHLRLRAARDDSQFFGPLDIQYKTYYILIMQGTDVEWDDDKNENNKREHDGLGFELAQLVFADPGRLERLDRSESNTSRKNGGKFWAWREKFFS